MYHPPIIVSAVPRMSVVPTAVAAICAEVRSALAERGTALVGLSGSPCLFELYANLGHDTSVDWKKVFFFSCDESFVPGCPTRSGTTRAAVVGSFDGVPAHHFVFPNVECGGAAESCSNFEGELENLLQLPDVIVLSAEEKTAGSAGYSNPIPKEAFDPERLAVTTHRAGDWIPFTISASISFMQRSRSVFFVLPTAEQTADWERLVLGEGGGNQVERVAQFAALSLMGNRRTQIIQTLPVLL